MGCTDLKGWDLVHWNPISAASALGTLGSVLAGFAISGLILVASLGRDRAVTGQGVLGLWTSVIPLVLASLLYSELAGEEDCRAAISTLAVASLLLALGGALLLISLFALLSESIGGVDAARFSMRLQWLTLGLLVLLVFSGNDDLRTLTSGERWSSTPEGVVQLGLLLACLPLSFAIVRQRGPRTLGTERGIVLVAAVVGTNLLYLLVDPGWSWIPTALSWARTVLTAGFVLVVGLQVPARYVHADPISKTRRLD